MKEMSRYEEIRERLKQAAEQQKMKEQAEQEQEKKGRNRKTPAR